MKELFWVSDEQWAVIEPRLPRNQPGAHRADDRRVISGILYVLCSGCRWRDCPKEYGPYTTIYNRFNRWCRRLVWRRILEDLEEAGQLSGTAMPCGIETAVRSCDTRRPRGRVRRTPLHAETYQ